MSIKTARIWLIPVAFALLIGLYTNELNDLNDVKNFNTGRIWFVRDNITGHGVMIIPGEKMAQQTLFLSWIGERVSITPQKGNRGSLEL